MTAAWPARIEDPQRLCRERDLPAWQDNELLKHCLPILGWHQVRYTDLDGVYVYDSSDGVQIESSDVTQYDRNALPLASSALNLTLNVVGHPASLQRGASDPRVTITGLRVSEDSPHVALAERIHVKGVGDVPYLVTEDEFDIAGLEEIKTAIIYAGSPAEFVAALSDSAALVHAIFLQNDDRYEWIEYAGGESLIDHQEIRDEVTLQITRAFAPDLLDARRQSAVRKIRR